MILGWLVFQMLKERHNKMKKWRMDSVKCEILFSLINPRHSGSSVALRVYEVSAKCRTKIYKGFSNIGCRIHGNNAELLIQGSFPIEYVNESASKMKTSQSRPWIVRSETVLIIKMRNNGSI